MNKDLIKQGLTIENVEDFVNNYGGEAIRKDDVLICRTICHNNIGEGHHKLYYYDNSHLFKCYTGCENDTFDIFELIIKIKEHQGIQLSLPQAIYEICNYFNLSFEEEIPEEISKDLKDDWTLLQKYDNLYAPKEEKIIQLKGYDDSVIKNYPQPAILSWQKEGIKKEVCDYHNIRYDPCNCGVIIPHYDINNNLVGIRERTLIKENEQYGKYRPAIFKGVMYNHALGYNLYNLNWSKNNIKALQKALVLEGEKGCLQLASYLGRDVDFSVAVCGSALLSYQVELLLKCGVKEIIIGFDKQFEDVNSDEGKKWIKKLKDINKKYSNFVNISFLFDKDNLLPYKASPTDKGIEIFMKLFNERIFL